MLLFRDSIKIIEVNNIVISIRRKMKMDSMAGSIKRAKRSKAERKGAERSGAKRSRAKLCGTEKSGL